MGRMRTKTRKGKPVVTKNTSEELQPPSIASLYQKAQSLVVQGDYDLALRFAQRILEREPRNVETRELLGVVQLETGDLDSARQVWISFIHNSPPR